MRTQADDAELAAYIAARIVVDANGCHIWQRALSTGYGVFTTRHPRFRRYAHRVAYELAKGPIPNGLHLDHLCRVPACINPAHLEAVTCAENIRRGEISRGGRRSNSRPLNERIKP